MSRQTPADSHPEVAADLQAFAREERGDDRLLRRAVVLAILAHAGLLGLHLPAAPGDLLAEEKPREPVLVLQTPRFEKKPPPEPREVPPRQPLQVPVPDPTPDDPEPLPVEEPEPPPVQIPELGDVVAIPEAPPPAVDEPVIWGAGIEPPRRLHAPAPAYTEAARRARREGVMILRATIDTAGRVRDLEVLRPLGLGLDEAALATVREWTFEPAQCDGRPVAVLYNLAIDFRIR